MLLIAMATHSLKGTFANQVLKISDDVIVTSFLNQSQQNYIFLFVIPRGISAQNLSKIGQQTKKLQFFVCEYFLLLPIDVPSFKLIEGQIKELQGVVPNTPWAENDLKSPGRIGLNKIKNSYWA